MDAGSWLTTAQHSSCAQLVLSISIQTPQKDEDAFWFCFRIPFCLYILPQGISAGLALFWSVVGLVHL